VAQSTTATRMAGPLLRNNEMAEAIIEAIQEDNPDKPMTVADHTGYIRVECADGLVLRRATVESILGRPFRMQELELIMPGFSGQIETTSEFVRWYFKS
jgi:toluene monooxygenase system protein D